MSSVACVRACVCACACVLACVCACACAGACSCACVCVCACACVCAYACACACAFAFVCACAHPHALSRTHALLLYLSMYWFLFVSRDPPSFNLSLGFTHCPSLSFSFSIALSFLPFLFLARTLSLALFSPSPLTASLFSSLFLLFSHCFFLSLSLSLSLKSWINVQPDQNDHDQFIFLDICDTSHSKFQIIINGSIKNLDLCATTFPSSIQMPKSKI